MDDERLELDSLNGPLKKDIARHCRYGHLVWPERNGCLVAGCKEVDSEYAKDHTESSLTEPQDD